MVFSVSSSNLDGNHFTENRLQLLDVGSNSFLTEPIVLYFCVFSVNYLKEDSVLLTSRQILVVGRAAKVVQTDFHMGATTPAI